MGIRPIPRKTTWLLLALIPLFITSGANALPGKLEKDFRRWVIGEMNWRPGAGVSLTTTAFARQHARAYPEAERFRGDCDAVSIRALAENRYLVLFQTEHLDLWVHHRAVRNRELRTWENLRASIHMEGAALTVTARSRPCEVLSKHLRVGADEDRALDTAFADSIPGRPLELYFKAAGGCGSGCSFSRLEMFRLDAAKPVQVYKANFELAAYSGAPPALEPLSIRLATPHKWPPDGFAFKFTSAVYTGAFTEFGPTVLRTCRWSGKSEEFSCEDTPIETFRWSSPYNSQMPLNKSDARFLSNNLARMRALGWLFEPSYLAQIERLGNSTD